MVYTSNTQGEVTTVHSEITASVTSSNTDAVDAIGFNGVLAIITLAGTTPNWTIDIEGCDTEDGTYIDCFDYTNLTPSDDTPKQLSTGALTASRICLFKGIPRYVKAVPTENSGTGNCTVKLMPINI